MAEAQGERRQKGRTFAGGRATDVAWLMSVVRSSCWGSAERVGCSACRGVGRRVSGGGVGGVGCSAPGRVGCSASVGGCGCSAPRRVLGGTASRGGVVCSAPGRVLGWAASAGRS